MKSRSQESEWQKVVQSLKSRADRDAVFLFVVKMLAESPVEVVSSLNKSDLINSDFDGQFRASLFVHHLLNDHKLEKKAFEYSFRDALRVAGHEAILHPRSTHPGADISVDGVGFSLKTEGAKGISPDRIHISKLMESAWMKGFMTLREFHASVKTHIYRHLRQYERMFTLRAFPVEHGWRYELLEIPLAVLRAVSTLKPSDLSALTKAHGTSAIVKWEGKAAWYLRFDGSDDKITVAGLSAALCKRHAEWTVKLKAGREAKPTNGQASEPA